MNISSIITSICIMDISSMSIIIRIIDIIIVSAVIMIDIMNITLVCSTGIYRPGTELRKCLHVTCCRMRSHASCICCMSRRTALSVAKGSPRSTRTQAHIPEPEGLEPLGVWNIYVDVCSIFCYDCYCYCLFVVTWCVENAWLGALAAPGRGHRDVLGDTMVVLLGVMYILYFSLSIYR